MHESDAALAAMPDTIGHSADLRRICDAARRFIACRELATAMASGHLPPAKSLAEAIQRDFLAFDLTRAERELREAVIAAEPTLAIPAPTLVFASRSDVRRRRRSTRPSAPSEATANTGN